jgi:predicted branched-subunit amino acid permease
VTGREAFRLGFVEGGSLPSWIVFTGTIGFGSLCAESDLSMAFALTMTATMWALPGQIAYVELYAAGNSLLAIVLAVAMANSRFLPMTASLMPYIRPGVDRSVWLYVLAQFISFNAWIWLARRAPELAPKERPIYFAGFVTALFAAGMIGTAVGYVLADIVPPAVTLGLVFLNVVYFALMFVGVRGRAPLVSVVSGALCAPALHLVTGDWALLITGVVCGTIGFAARERSHG